MRRGTIGEKRPADVIDKGVSAMQIATDEINERLPAHGAGTYKKPTS